MFLLMFVVLVGVGVLLSSSLLVLLSSLSPFVARVVVATAAQILLQAAIVFGQQYSLSLLFLFLSKHLPVL